MLFEFDVSNAELNGMVITVLVEDQLTQNNTLVIFNVGDVPNTDPCVNLTGNTSAYFYYRKASESSVQLVFPSSFVVAPPAQENTAC